ncbi:BON domain-containing protein [Paraburkholderia acidiphila]|uniref:BON domain-containing protein n=1 Tax=Paraburkholderia acidiphila TaxID=2571747 RepID=A0A7Z2G4S7_9BURK|nr:BON domain-containing protein [Paraburkholderia acidiphila]QGZ55140.1 BON domain-containing protein [Paraburkholderia acidiphila]
MNVIRYGRLLAVTTLFAASLQAHAQGGGASSSTPAAVAASVGAAPASTKAADRALRRRVLNALAKAKGLRASGITVRAVNGAVTLEGWVPEQAQIEQATRVAQNVAGVTSVSNTLTLSTF